MTSRGLSSAEVAAALAERWGSTVVSLAPNDGGMNSQTWFVDAGDDRFVAKAVPADRAASFAAAALVEASGLRAGAPVPSTDGRSCVRIDDTILALLRFVSGAELTGESVAERALMGSTLGRAHVALAGPEVAGASRFHWIDPTAAHLDLRPWIRPAVDATIAGYDAIPPESLTWGPPAHRPCARSLAPGPDDRHVWPHRLGPRRRRPAAVRPGLGRDVRRRTRT